MGLTERATRLIEARGRAVTLQRETPGGQDGFGGQLPGTWTDYPAVAATASFSEMSAVLAAGLIEAGDLRLFMSADGLAITPAVFDRVVADGETYRVIRVTPYGADGIPRMFELQIRRDPIA